jgi:hypothetical protein
MAPFPLQFTALLFVSMGLAPVASFAVWRPLVRRPTLSYGLKVPMKDFPIHFDPSNKRGAKTTTRGCAGLPTRLNSLATSPLAFMNSLAILPTRWNSLVAFMNSLAILFVGCFFAACWLAMTFHAMDHIRETGGILVCAVITMLCFAGGCVGSWKGQWVYVLPVILWQVVTIAAALMSRSLHE